MLISICPLINIFKDAGACTHTHTHIYVYSYMYVHHTRILLVTLPVHVFQGLSLLESLL